MNAKRRKFLLLILICFLLLVLLAVGAVFGVRSVKRMIDQAGLSNALTLKSDDFPVIDGTYFMQAYGEATRASLTGESIIIARENVMFTGADSAKERLLGGDCDIALLSGTDTQDIAARAKERGVALSYYTIAKDGQVIYCGEEVEERDVSIQRFTELYKSDTDGLGYSTYCYWLSSLDGEGSCLMTVDGIAPNEQTIASGEYPQSYNIYAVFRDGGIASDTQRVVAWMLGEEGQKTLTDLGYINTRGDAIAEGAGANAYTYYATRNATSAESTGLRVIKGSAGSPVTVGTTTTYLIENPTAWAGVKAEKGSYLALSGLANETAQNAVNDRIAKAYEELAALEIPEFRGIRLTIPPESLLIRTEVSATVLYNYNNVVSIRMQGDYTYALPNEDGVIGENAWGYYESTKTLTCCDYLNFDLNTGREFVLESVFTDGADYRRIVSNKVSADPVFMTNVILTGSDKGVRPDQKFYLQDDALYIVFDQDSPEYILRDPKETSIIIYFSDIAHDLAITARYYDEETVGSLYKSYTGAGKVLIPNREILDVTGENAFTYANVAIRQSWTYSSTLSSYGKRMVANAYAVDWSVMSKLIANDREAQYDISVTGRRLQNYLSLTITDRRWLEGGTDETYTRYATYDLDTLHRAELADLFWAGFDYRSVIRTELEEEIALRGGLVKTVRGETVPLTEEETEKKITSLLDTINGFAIDNRRISISFYPLEFEGGTASVTLQIPYPEFGSDNVTIFR